MGAHVDYFPIRAAFPDNLAGRHPRRHFRGLLGLHLMLRPTRLLNHPRRPLSRGFDPASYPAKPLVSTRPIDNYLGEFFLHGLSVPFRGTQAIGG